MIDIQRAEELLAELIDELPDGILQGLNGGILLSDEEKIHPESKEGDKLLILGQYIISNLGSQIVIYYGSFESLFWYYDDEAFKDKLREILHHELTHHLEYLAGENDLAIDDMIFMEKYRNEN
ncbi:metallopeptidase family protein [Peptoniphilus sp. GNH]|nr:hypothetical protein HMPREF3189_00278 [Clostridiales bacterium KA00134]UHR03329.1 metallopeptidase family protein [Peptoniphilus sp. GNH]